eukprot:TRINITY_DN66690_c0_g1_i1.p1 TRINITY_DN66690_c0_g1~~TRINITY_DN66690_c0_g1_i1.p1  ORF type:complete len:795 (+),score=130.26 TRINITY_DN66690_c0_g1_i1:70-2385(+)
MAPLSPQARGSSGYAEDGSADHCSAQQAIILAAGRGSRLAPYTDSVPTALISIGGKPMIAHNIAALRRQGVERFLICRGWQGNVFDDHLDSLGPGVSLIDCPDFSSTGMLESLRLSISQLDPGPFYVCYGDIIFRPSVARQLVDAAGKVTVVVNVAAPGQQSKGFAEVEAVAVSDNGSERLVRRIGKCRRISEANSAGEFAGLVKFSECGRAIMEETLRRIFQDDSSSTGQTDTFSLPWWLEPVQKASLCDLLQLMADEGVCLSLAKIFGGWHEVNTPQDLTRAWNDTAMFLSEEDTRSQVKAMGACLLSEANDLKRPLPIVAKELNVSLDQLECLLRGNLEVSDALDVLRKMSEVYPVPLNDLWLDADDTTGGVRMFSCEAAESSARVLERKDRTGQRTPYYEYRDAAMSRCSQFRPEWIKELRIVKSRDPLDPDVQMNNGHLMMQTTLFIGPVDFYYTDRHGKVQRREMNTGDSNYISPFVPHSFTARAESPEAIIIAVTYGGSVRRAFTELSRVGAGHVMSLAGDSRDPACARRCVLKRCLDSECMTSKTLTDALEPFGIAAGRVDELLQGSEASHAELESLAAVLSVRVSDLYVCPLQEDEEVVVTYAAETRARARHLGTYTMAPLARTRHQPDLKTFDLEVLDSANPGDGLSCGLHSFVYHFGSEPVELRWVGRTGSSHVATMRPGDSAYVAPMVEHRFSVCSPSTPKDREATSASNPNGAARGTGRRLFLVRIPGHLSGETLAEFATFSAHGRERVGAETVQWYN